MYSFFFTISSSSHRSFMHFITKPAHPLKSTYSTLALRTNPTLRAQPRPIFNVPSTKSQRNPITKSERAVTELDPAVTLTRSVTQRCEENNTCMALMHSEGQCCGGKADGSDGGSSEENVQMEGDVMTEVDDRSELIWQIRDRAQQHHCTISLLMSEKKFMRSKRLWWL